MINRVMKSLLGTLAAGMFVIAVPQIASAGSYGSSDYSGNSGYHKPRCHWVEKQVRYYDKYTYTYKYRIVRKKVCDY